jgi:sulfur relay (sulfurtransferase) complex TusBCD TusD component (DsrE family)
LASRGSRNRILSDVGALGTNQSRGSSISETSVTASWAKIAEAQGVDLRVVSCGSVATNTGVVATSRAASTATRLLE